MSPSACSSSHMSPRNQISSNPKQQHPETQKSHSLEIKTHTSRTRKHVTRLKRPRPSDAHAAACMREEGGGGGAKAALHAGEMEGGGDGCVHLLSLMSLGTSLSSQLMRTSCVFSRVRVMPSLMLRIVGTVLPAPICAHESRVMRQASCVTRHASRA